jgi:LemA protein
MPPWLLFLALTFAIGIWFVLSYNRLVRANSETENGRAQVDVYLQKRHDLIPGVVETVRGYAAHERETLERVTQARADALRPSSPGDRGFERELRLGRALMDFRVVTERYPELKADAQFLNLHAQLRHTEDLLERARQHYNDRVKTQHDLVRQIPGNVVASLTGMDAVPPYFKAVDEAERAPQFSFSPTRGPG